MSFANTVARNFAAPEGAFPELSASPPAAPVAAAPASSWGGRGAEVAAKPPPPKPKGKPVKKTLSLTGGGRRY